MCSHPPQPARSRSALGPQLCWDGTVPGGCLRFGRVLGAGPGTCRASIPIPSQRELQLGEGTWQRGRKALSLISLLPLPPRIGWDEPSENMGAHLPGISQPPPSPCRLSSCVCPHHDSLQPPSISLWSSWKKGRFEQPKHIHCSPLPPNLFPFLTALIQRKDSAVFQVSTRPCLAQLLRAADDSVQSGRICSSSSVPAWLRSHPARLHQQWCWP